MGRIFELPFIIDYINIYTKLCTDLDIQSKLAINLIIDTSICTQKIVMSPIKKEIEIETTLI